MCRQPLVSVVVTLRNAEPLRFRSAHAADIRGHVLEIADDTYTRRFGGDRVTTSDVLHFIEGQPGATVVADLTCAEHLPSATFDCVILTQTLQFIRELPTALRAVGRILRPGGIVLATIPGISPISSTTWNAGAAIGRSPPSRCSASSK
jgi:SAM-dependent methyltransferase